MHLEDMKDSIEVRPPGGNRGFILLRVEHAGDSISFFRFDGGPLDLRHGSAIEGMVSKPGTVSSSGSSGSRRQLLNRF